MFYVSSNDTIEISFHHNSVKPNETSDKYPTHKITIRSNVQESSNGVTKYDEETAQEEDYEVHNPVIMPKINNDNDNHKDEANALSAPPKQSLEPPLGD